MVTTDALARLRALNFGVRLLRRRLEPSAVVEEIARYDAEDAAAVCARVREEAGLENALDRIEAIYRRALATPPFGDPSPAAESRSASRYLLFLAPTLKQAWGVAQERDRLAAALEACRSGGDRLREGGAERTDELGSEISRMRGTITWRTRDFLLRSRVASALHRALRRVL
jgi:hypothetical protein